MDRLRRGPHTIESLRLAIEALDRQQYRADAPERTLFHLDNIVNDTEISIELGIQALDDFYPLQEPIQQAPGIRLVEAINERRTELNKVFLEAQLIMKRSIILLTALGSNKYLCVPASRAFLLYEQASRQSGIRLNELARTMENLQFLVQTANRAIEANIRAQRLQGVNEIQLEIITIAAYQAPLLAEVAMNPAFNAAPPVGNRAAQPENDLVRQMMVQMGVRDDEDSLMKIMKPYDGNPLRWAEFHSVFTQEVHENARLNNLQKLAKLKKAVTGKLAADLEPFMIHDGQYEPAWEFVQARYGDRIKIQNALDAELKAIPEATSDSESLRNTVNKLKVLSASMADVIDVEHPAIRQNMEKLIPGDILILVKRDMGANNTTARFLECLEKVVDSKEYVDSLQKGKFQAGHTVLQFQPTYDDEQQCQKWPCPFCGLRNHRAHDCIEYASVDERIDRLKEKDKCLRCLSGEHRARDCQRDITCFRCGVSQYCSLSQCPLQINVLQQIINIASHEFLKEYLESGKLFLHGMWFDIYSGNNYLFSKDDRRYVSIEENTVEKLMAELEKRCVRRVPENRPAAAKALDEASGLKNEPFYAEFCTRLYWLEPDSKNTLPRPVDGKCEPEPTIEAQLEASAELVEIVDKMREGKEVTVEEKWVKKAIERKMIPAEFTSEDGFQLDITRMMNILHSPIFRGVLSRTRGWLSLQNSQEYPSEMAVYECAGVWKELLLWGNDSGEDGINCSSFAIRNIQKLLNGGTSEGRGFDIHRGPWHFPFIGEKQKAFEEKYNVRIALITHERDESTDRLLSIFPCNKPETLLSLGDGSERYFEISMASPFDIGKYEQMELGIMAKDETMKVTSEKINEWTYKRTMEPEEEGEEPWIWTANYRPTFDDINCFHCLKGPLPDMAAAASDPYPELALLDAENRILVQTLTDQMVNGEPALKELAEEDEDYLLYKEEIAQEEALKSHPPEEFFFEDNEI
ncbi:unnamed protein product, partial [Mesorhabditis spiculigera]